MKGQKNSSKAKRRGERWMRLNKNEKEGPKISIDCRKICYKTELDVVKAIARKTTPKKLYHYNCWKCGNWHKTSMKNYRRKNGE